MRLAIDATMLKEGVLTGVERYTIALIRNLVQLETGDEVFVVCNGGVHSSLADLSPRFTPIVWPLPHPALRFLREQVWMPAVLRQLGVEVAHFPFYPPSVFCPGRVVLTILDAGLYLFPQLMAPMINYYHKPLIWSGLRRGMIRCIVTLSQTARADLLRCLPVPEGMISAVYPCVDGITSTRLNTRGGKWKVAGGKWNLQLSTFNFQPSTFNLDGPYILTIGMYMPLKNVPVLLRAFAQLRERCPDYALVIVGRRGWDHRLPVDDPPPGVIFTGYVSDDDLEALLTGAALFAFPTLYEGFGLPVLEAMHDGVPVVCSDIPVLHEVAGQAAVFADPQDPQDFALKMEAVLRDPARRRDLVAAGLERVKTFGGGRDFALRMRAVYQAVSDG